MGACTTAPFCLFRTIAAPLLQLNLLMSHVGDDGLVAPILVTGTPRSGKTLVAWILQQAPGITYVNEPLAVWAIGAGQRDNDRRLPDEATPEVVRQIRSQCLRELRRTGGTRYLEDLSYHALRIDFVRAVMPEALIVHVIQDGYQAIPQMVYGWTFTEPFYRSLARRWRSVNLGTALRSLPALGRRWLVNHWASKTEGRRRAWGPQPPGLAEFARTHPDPAEIAAFQWMRMVEIALQDLERVPQDRAMTVYYEDLMADSEAVVARVARFCGLDEVDELQRAAGELLDPHAPKKQVELTDRQWARIKPMIAPLRERLGYPADVALR